MGQLSPWGFNGSDACRTGMVSSENGQFLADLASPSIPHRGAESEESREESPEHVEKGGRRTEIEGGPRGPRPRERPVAKRLSGRQVDGAVHRLVRAPELRELFRAHRPRQIREIRHPAEERLLPLPLILSPETRHAVRNGGTVEHVLRTPGNAATVTRGARSEEHTSELQSR